MSAIISVIVPVYKVEHYLRKCVDSVLAQSFDNFELILVDDGSPDNCPTICDEYARMDSRVHVIHQQNGGLSAARNAGIDWVFANSNSEWITFIDSDDWVHPQYLEKLYETAIEKAVSVVACDYVETDGTISQCEGDIPKATIFQPEDFFVANRVLAIIACGKLYKKECFENIRYPVGKLHEDEFTTYKVLFSFDKIAHIPYPMYYYFINPNGITKSSWSPKRLDTLTALREQIKFFVSNGYTRAAETVFRVYVFSYIDHKTTVEKYPEYSSFSRKITGEFHRTFSKYHYLLPFRKNIWIYEKFKPKTVKLYWLVKGIKQKIRTLLGVNDANN